MLIVLMTNGTQFANEYANNPVILDGAEMEASVFSVVQTMAKATEKERRIIAAFAGGFVRENCG